MTCRFAVCLLCIGWVGPLGCDGENRFAPVESGSGPIVESRPARLRSCTKGKPVVRLETPKGAPIEVTIERAYHTCFKNYAALLRLKSRSVEPITLIWLEREQIDVTGRRAPQRRRIPFTRPFRRGDTRYFRLRWNESLQDPGQRNLRVRLQAVFYGGGGSWRAPAWPTIAARPTPKPPPSPLEKAAKAVRGIHKRLKARVAKSAPMSD